MNPADTAWIIVATALVLFMTLPGLALFYGGLVRARGVRVRQEVHEPVALRLAFLPHHMHRLDLADELASL